MRGKFKRKVIVLQRWRKKRWIPPEESDTTNTHTHLISIFTFVKMREEVIRGRYASKEHETEPTYQRRILSVLVGGINYIVANFAKPNENI